MAVVYSCCNNMSSGARYHLVTTCLQKKKSKGKSKGKSKSKSKVSTHYIFHVDTMIHEHGESRQDIKFTMVECRHSLCQLPGDFVIA